MTEPVFVIVPQNNVLIEPLPKPDSRYRAMLYSFLTTSYGYYMEMFIKKISEHAQQTFEGVRRCDLRKNLRQSGKKYLMSDLQIVFLGHFCQKNEWNYHHKEIESYSEGKFQIDEKNQYQMRIFIEFNAYFVKSYLGNSEQFSQLESYLSEEDPSFLSHFQQWANTISRQSFIISPKEINKIYSKYSRNCNNNSNKKDYNQLVDTIIELSTTYSIMPGRKNEKQKQTKEKQQNVTKVKREAKKVKVENKIDQKVPQVRNLSKQLGLFEMTNSMMKKDSSQQKRPVNQRSLIDYRRGSTSSAIFEGLFGLDRNSQLKRINSNNSILEEVERSREKKTTKLLKRFNKDSQKPNQAVLGFITNPIPEGSPQKQKQCKHFLRDRPHRNPNLGSNRNPSFGIFNIQSNISSKSIALPPIPFKGSQQGFFDRSRLD